MFKFILIVGSIILINKIAYYSHDTYKMLDDMMTEAIQKASKDYDIEENIIKAVIKRESDNVPFAIRIERHKIGNENYIKHLTEEEKEDSYSYCSFGVMQIMFVTAKVDLGYTGTANNLSHLRINIDLGSKYLAKLYRKYGNMWDAVSSYNQGNPRKVNGQYKNNAHVEAVKNNYISFGGGKYLDN